MFRRQRANFKEHEDGLNQPKDLRGRFCPRPFTRLEIHNDFNAYSCCPSWLPTIIGNCATSSIEDVWNSDVVRELRQSIIDGSFRNCDHRQCPHIQMGTLPKFDPDRNYSDLIDSATLTMKVPPNEISLSYDQTCNLACPSCRTEKIQHSTGKDYHSRLSFTEKIIDFINKHANHHPITLRVTGSGDPIASPVFFHLLKSLDAKNVPYLKIVLQTNGTMFTERVWNQLEPIQSCISEIQVSVDAATESTYRIVRKYGNWQQLQKNLSFFGALLRRQKISQFGLCFVVQKMNYREMVPFIRRAYELDKFSYIFFSLVNDWGTWPKQEYVKQCIWKTSHPEYGQFIDVLKNPIFDDPKVILGNLSTYRKKALSINASADSAGI